MTNNGQKGPKHGVLGLFCKISSLDLAEKLKITENEKLVFFSSKRIVMLFFSIGLKSCLLLVDQVLSKRARGPVMMLS